MLNMKGGTLKQYVIVDAKVNFNDRKTKVESKEHTRH